MRWLLRWLFRLLLLVLVGAATVALARRAIESRPNGTPSSWPPVPRRPAG